jgi:hypothetical protein
MNKYFETTVRYMRQNEHGIYVPVTEQYLIEACSFIEAETRITQVLEPYMTEASNFIVKAIKRSNVEAVVSDAFNLESEVQSNVSKMIGTNKNLSESADRYYRVKVNFITIDEKTDKEKKDPAYYLVAGNSTRTAENLITLYLHDTVADYEIADITETKILEVYIVKDSGNEH